jgi:hypothetical protein
MVAVTALATTFKVFAFVLTGPALAIEQAEV